MHSWIAFPLIIFAATGMVFRLDFADELIFCLVTLIVLNTLLSRGGSFDRRLFWIIVLIIAGLLFAQIFTFYNDVPLLVTTLGYWQLWRGHIAIAIGLLLVIYGKHIPSWPILKLLQFNIFFTLLQPFLGDSFMVMVYPAGYIEYRSGILRAVGIFSNPNTNAFFVSLYLLAIWRDLILGRGANWGKSLFFLSFTALIATGSRSSLLIMPILLFLMWFISRKWKGPEKEPEKERRSVISGVTKIWFILLVLGSLFFLSMRQVDSTSGGYSLLPDMEVVTNTENLSEGYFRAIATVYSFSHFLDHPIFGLGYGSYGTPASFSWPSPYLESDGFLIFSDTGENKLKQLDVLLPVILAESGGVGILIWLILLWRLIAQLKCFSRDGSLIFSTWIAALLVATLSGPGITHPIVIALIPFVMKWLLSKEPFPKIFYIKK